MQEGGYPIEECEAEGVTIPVVNIECKYKFPAKMGDVLRVSAHIDTLPLAKLVIKQKVCNQDGMVCAEGKVILGFLNKNTGRPVRCPEKLIELIKASDKSGGKK